MQALATKESDANLGTRLTHLARLGAIKTALTVSRKLGGEEASLRHSMVLRSTALVGNWLEPEEKGTQQLKPGDSLWLLYQNLRTRVGDTEETPSSSSSRRELKRWGLKPRSLSSRWGAAARSDGSVGASVIADRNGKSRAAAASLLQSQISAQQKVNSHKSLDHFSPSRFAKLNTPVHLNASQVGGHRGSMGQAAGGEAAMQPSSAVVWSRATYGGSTCGGAIMQRVLSSAAGEKTLSETVSTLHTSTSIPSAPVRSTDRKSRFLSDRLLKLKPDNEAAVEGDNLPIVLGTASEDFSMSDMQGSLPCSPEIQSLSPPQKVRSILPMEKEK